MSSRTVTTEKERRAAADFILAQKLPFSFTVRRGRNRSQEQNALAHAWYRRVADEFGDRTFDEVRAYSKLHLGVAIRRREDPAYRAGYDRVVKPLDYEEKLEIMGEPIDFPVTSGMSVKEMQEYLEAMQHHFAQQGILLEGIDDVR